MFLVNFLLEKYGLRLADETLGWGVVGNCLKGLLYEETGAYVLLELSLEVLYILVKAGILYDMRFWSLLGIL